MSASTPAPYEGATRRPWYAEGPRVWPRYLSERPIADCFHGVHQETEEANAALIVAAVNAYDPEREGKIKALVKAAKRVLAAYRGRFDDTPNALFALDEALNPWSEE